MWGLQWFGFENTLGKKINWESHDRMLIKIKFILLKSKNTDMILEDLV